MRAIDHSAEWKNKSGLLFNKKRWESFKKRGVYGEVTPSEWKHPRVLGSGAELNSLSTLYQQAVSNTISD